MSLRSAARIAAAAATMFSCAATAWAQTTRTPADAAPTEAAEPRPSEPNAAPPPAESLAPGPAVTPLRTEPGVPAALAGSPAQAMMTLHGWKGTFYGFIELDAIRDSTQSFSDSVGNSPLLRSDGSSPVYLPIGTQALGVTYGSKNPRFHLTPRNTTFGFKVEPPEVNDVKTAGVIEFDFFGNQPTSPFNPNAGNAPTTESSYMSSAAPRMRHAYVEMKSSIVDVFAGQSYHLFGWQPLFFPPTDSFLGTPNMVFDRRAQLRLTKRIETSAIDIRIAGAALRPAQSDSGIPDVAGGIVLQMNDWKGAHMLGPSQPKHDALAIGVSGVYREFRVAQFLNNVGNPGTAERVAKTSGYGISVDALLPVIPVKDLKDRRNGLTLTGAFVTGTGIGDLYTGGLTGGANFPLPTGPNGPFTGTYGANVDPGAVQYSIKVDPSTHMPVADVNGNCVGILRTLNWQSYMVGLQYYLPFLEGRFVVAGNYTHASSNNIQQQSTASFDAEKTAGGDPTRTFKAASYYDANLFIGITDSFKAALSWQHVEQVFLATGLAGTEVMRDSPEHNDRLEISTFFFF